MARRRRRKMTKAEAKAYQTLMATALVVVIVAAVIAWVAYHPIVLVVVVLALGVVIAGIVARSRAKALQRRRELDAMALEHQRELDAMAMARQRELDAMARQRELDAMARQRELELIRRSGIFDIDRWVEQLGEQRAGTLFEERVGLALRDSGWDVTPKGQVRDFGCDLLVQNGVTSAAVQCKCYAGSVGAKAVQEVFAARFHYGTEEAWVVTNREFTTAAYELADSCGVKLIARSQLIELLAAARQPALAPVRRSAWPPSANYGLRSDDGRWWWDGQQWQAVRQPPNAESLNGRTGIGGDDLSRPEP